MKPRNKNRSLQYPTITIKLKPYLQDFLISKLHEGSFASTKSIIGALIYPLISYAPKDYIPSFDKNADYITFVLPVDIGKKFCTKHHSVIMTEQNQRVFERMLSLYFKEIFFNYVEDKFRFNNSIKSCILCFCSDYDISFNNITYEMLKKAYYRHRLNSKFIRRLFVHVLSPK